VVENIKLWLKTLGLNDFIPGGRLQVCVYHLAFIKSSMKKYDFIEKDKNILNPIVCGREGKGTWWKMDLKLALYLIITTL
jgi:hypothetical protein